MKLGAASQQAPKGWKLVKLKLPKGQESIKFALHKDKLREARRREGRYLMRSNMPKRSPDKLWEFYLQLVQVEEAFKHLKGDLALRPFHHQKEERIEAHVFVAFLAYCLNQFHK